jgi:hypothetical protein
MTRSVSKTSRLLTARGFIVCHGRVGRVNLQCVLPLRTADTAAALGSEYSHGLLSCFRIHAECQTIAEKCAHGDQQQGNGLERVNVGDEIG